MPALRADTGGDSLHRFATPERSSIISAGIRRTEVELMLSAKMEKSTRKSSRTERRRTGYDWSFALSIPSTCAGGNSLRVLLHRAGLTDTLRVRSVGSNPPTPPTRALERIAWSFRRIDQAGGLDVSDYSIAVKVRQRVAWACL